MKKYKYRLQALLNMKEHIEKEKQKQLATSTKRVQQQERKLGEVADGQRQTLDHQRKQSAGRFSVAEMLVISRFLHKLKRDSVLGQELLKVLKKEEESRRDDLIEATKERKKYEKLKEKQREKHSKEMESAMTKENDETAITTYRQKTEPNHGK